MSLEPGESYSSPTLYGASTDNGLSALSGAFHGYIRSFLTDRRVINKVKTVHFNTWEAVYFDLSFDRLCELADSAAEVGVERFVLDDGWFKNRKSDSAGLGDWFVDETVLWAPSAKGRSSIFAVGLAPRPGSSTMPMFQKKGAGGACGA